MEEMNTTEALLRAILELIAKCNTLEELSAPVIKCKKTPRKKCNIVAERRGKR